MARRTGYADLPLYSGRAPRWLFSRMTGDSPCPFRRNRERGFCRLWVLKFCFSMLTGLGHYLNRKVRQEAKKP